MITDSALSYYYCCNRLKIIFVPGSAAWLRSNDGGCDRLTYKLYDLEDVALIMERIKRQDNIVLSYLLKTF